MYFTKGTTQGDIFIMSDPQEDIYAQKQGDWNITQYFTTLKKLARV